MCYVKGSESFFFHLSYRYYIIAVDRGREREKKIAFYVKKKAIVV